MNLMINFHQMDSTEAIKETIAKKCQKLEKYLDSEVQMQWTCDVEHQTHHSKASLNYHGHSYIADSKKDDLYKTIDDIVTKLEKQLLKAKNKSMVKHYTLENHF